MEIKTLADLIFDTPRSELIKIIGAYNNYVVDFYETHDEGSCPVSLMEFYNNDYVDKDEIDLGVSFINDVDKMADFLELSKEKFLQSYLHLTTSEYDETKNQFNNNKVEILADLMRTAENLLLEESNDRPTNYQITGKQLKILVANYALNNLTTSEYKDFEDICNSMGC